MLLDKGDLAAFISWWERARRGSGWSPWRGRGRSGDEVPEDAGGRRGLELVQWGAFWAGEDRGCEGGAGRASYEWALIFPEKKVKKKHHRRVLDLRPPAPYAVCQPHFPWVLLVSLGGRRCYHPHWHWGRRSTLKSSPCTHHLPLRVLPEPPSLVASKKQYPSSCV